MNRPTELGWYWRRYRVFGSLSAWEVVFVNADREVCTSGHYGATPIDGFETGGGEWGPRIEPPEEVPALPDGVCPRCNGYRKVHVMRPGMVVPCPDCGEKHALND